MTAQRLVKKFGQRSKRQLLLCFLCCFTTNSSHVFKSCLAVSGASKWPCSHSLSPLTNVMCCEARSYTTYHCIIVFQSKPFSLLNFQFTCKTPLGKNIRNYFFFKYFYSRFSFPVSIKKKKNFLYMFCCLEYFFVSFQQFFQLTLQNQTRNTNYRLPFEVPIFVILQLQLSFPVIF